MGKKTGSYYPCVICNTPRWRSPSDVKRNIRRTCSRECYSKMMSGPGNPFWGKVHDETAKAKIAETKRARPTSKRTGPPKGYKHTPEARKKMSDAVRERWATNRDKMLMNLPRGQTHPMRILNPDPRYRSNFTPWQRENWKAEKCLWCETTDNLVLDHVIPVMAGGKSEKCNAQTLCQPCNLWKMKYMDRAIYGALLGSKGG